MLPEVISCKVLNPKLSFNTENGIIKSKSSSCEVKTESSCLKDEKKGKDEKKKALEFLSNYENNFKTLRRKDELHKTFDNEIYY